MKRALIFVVCFLAVASGVPVFAQQQEENTRPFQGGLTYIKYRLNQDAFPVWDLGILEKSIEDDAETTTLTFEKDEIDEIDAYFEPEVSNFTLGKRDNWQYCSPEVINAIETNWTPESTPDGTLWLKISYDRIRKGQADEFSGDEHLIRGKLNLPLGESSFSLGAYVAMYAARIHDLFTENSRSPGVAQPHITENSAGVPGIAQAAFAGNPTEQGEAVTPDTPGSRVLSSRSAVLGAVNFSGAVKGVDVFTEVGFASGTGGFTENSAADTIDGTNFYALGGAKYTLGQVTVGIEAGFENGNDPIDNVVGNFPGFENDFWFDRVLQERIPGNELNNKLYAKVSASMNPIEKINVEGAFSCIKPMGAVDRVDYGLEVNGAVYYALTDYVKYLIKAGVSSLLENASIEESQYKFINRLEFKF